VTIHHHHETYIRKMYQGKTCGICGKDLPKGTGSYYVIDFSREHFDTRYICVDCMEKKESEGLENG
jgi:hypothetical protein